MDFCWRLLSGVYINAQINVFFAVFMALFAIFLNFPRCRVCKGSFLDFFRFYVFYRCQKNGLIDFPGKRVPTKVTYLLTVCQILRNFTEGTSRNFTAFCAHVDIIKYRKKLKFPFERAQIA